MAEMMDAKLKKDKIRRREKPNKKWTEEEVGQVPNYLQGHPSFEMPSAQIFYKKLLLETGISADWNLVRWKVRNMRTAYNKTEQWRNGTGAGLLEEQGIESIDQKTEQDVSPL
ncbi:uncharacterized protein LOC125779541 [Bactrocera dorsalis]|uniref:Uncharacterized protein LOC125779541 n=1 Tax=Bactrocera dorsalis TaxID=27457 RepID=A0ABM3K5V0_BACDO|nr:uncharacterized protein LOC125779541 [Bactrocera dorsalis]